MLPGIALLKIHSQQPRIDPTQKLYTAPRNLCRVLHLLITILSASGRPQLLSVTRVIFVLSDAFLASLREVKA